MNRKEFLKMITISPIALVMNRLLGTFGFEDTNKSEIYIAKNGMKWLKWTLPLPFGGVTVFQTRDWGPIQKDGKRLYTYYKIEHDDDRNVGRWGINPEWKEVIDWVRMKDLSAHDKK